MYNPFGGNKFPYTNFHELNLDWIIEIAKNFLDQYTHIQETIETGLEDLEAKKTELEGLLQAWYDEHSQDIADQLADALQDLNTWYSQHQDYLDQTLADNEEEFSRFAVQKAQEVSESIPADYSDLSKTVLAIKDFATSRTAQIFNYEDCTILNGYVNSETLKFNENEACRFTYIDVTDYRGQTINVFSPYRTFLQLSAFTEEPQLETPLYATHITSQMAAANQYDRNLSITIGDTDTYLGIWYWYGTFNHHPSDDVLKALYVYTGNVSVYPKLFLTANTTKDSFDNNEYYLSPYIYEDFPTDNSANATLYMTNYVYEKGLVKSITTYFHDTGTATVLIVSTVDGAVLKKYSKSGTGEITIPVNEYIGVPFYLAIGGTGASYVSSTFSSTDLSWLGINSIPDSGDYTDIEFPTMTSSQATYIITQKVTYFSVYDTVYPTRYTNSLNKLLIAGDSITAGHNQYVVGEHWWEAVCREYNFYAVPTARSGSGFSYWNGLNACKIAHDNSFDDIGVAVFAFGTNDYGNNIPLGTIDDTYTYSEDSSQTFYAAVKYVIETVLTKNANTTLILSLPINRSREGSLSTRYAYGTPNDVGFTLMDYCNAMIACCNKYGINYIDNTKGSFNLISTPHLLYDGLHPSEMGYKKLGQDMAGKLGALIRPYPEYDGINGYGQF